MTDFKPEGWLLHKEENRQACRSLGALQAAMEQEEWIIDGNYSSTMEWRMAACDTVFFLDYPTEICLQGIEARRGQARSDLPWIESDTIDPEFSDFVRKYHTESRPDVIRLLKTYSEKNVFVFRSRQEADAYLSRQQKSV